MSGVEISASYSLLGGAVRGTMEVSLRVKYLEWNSRQVCHTLFFFIQHSQKKKNDFNSEIWLILLPTQNKQCKLSLDSFLYG